MKQVTFGNQKSFSDLYLILNKKEIGSPEVKTETVDIKGADGVLDMTEHFGRVNYGNRQLKFEFSTIAVPFLDYFSALSDSLHGRKVRIILDEEPTYYYIGRLKVSAFNSSKSIGHITIDAECEPYKYKLNQTTVTRAINGTTTITLNNSNKRVVPTITATAAMTFNFGGYTYAASAGTFVIPQLELIEGANTVSVTGTGTVTFVYQEGRL